MTPDEYEARLRMAALHRHAGWCGGSVAGCTHWQEEEAALDAYADWLRLRAVAGQRCYRRQGIEEWDDYGDVYCDCFELRDTESPNADLCPPCDAERRMAEILAEASEVTT